MDEGVAAEGSPSSDFSSVSSASRFMGKGGRRKMDREMESQVEKGQRGEEEDEKASKWKLSRETITSFAQESFENPWGILQLDRCRNRAEEALVSPAEMSSDCHLMFHWAQGPGKPG